MRREATLDGALLDRVTQRWVIATGRPVEFGGSERWLDGPIGAPGGVGEAWIQQHAAGTDASLKEDKPQGLLPGFAALSGAVPATRCHCRRWTVLSSPAGEFGDDGAYLVVRPNTRSQGWARRIPLPERFELFTDADGVLRCDHHLNLGRREILRLHYRLQRAPSR